MKKAYRLNPGSEVKNHDNVADFKLIVLECYQTVFQTFWRFEKLKVRIFRFSHFWKDPRGFWDNPRPNPTLPSQTLIAPFSTTTGGILIIFGVLKSWKFVFFDFLIFKKIHVDFETTPCRIPAYSHGPWSHRSSSLLIRFWWFWMFWKV